MGHNAFLNPAVLQDTPRLFTAFAEWLAVFVYLNIYKRRLHEKSFVCACSIFLFALIAFQFLAGCLSIWFWIPTMIGAVAIMYFELFTILNISAFDCGVLTTHAFVLAEFAASLYRQLYVWFVYISGIDTVLASSIFMIIVYFVVFTIYYKVERGNIPANRDLEVTKPELVSVLATGIGAFIMSNISFVWSSTPFSASDSMLYVRTLVDFGGMLMLMTQMGRRNEQIIKTESDAINQLFHRQYEQYKLAIDNSEALRKEMHDMKHYLAALKDEEDPKKRAEVLADMEQSIAIQESFMNTGNRVLDVILTMKSLQCEKKAITLNAMVDGETLSGIHVKDICSLFGNILDNAIEATQQVEEADKRLISLSVRKKNQFIIVECENFSGGAIAGEQAASEAKNISSDNLPKTTKTDTVHHGFGLKSIAKVAEKYGGAMNISCENGWFKVKVLLSNKN